MMRAMVFALSLVSAAGCTIAEKAELPQGLPPHLGAGDVVEVTYEKKRCELTVAADGTLKHPLFGVADVAGLSLPEAEKALRNAAKRVQKKPVPLTLRLIKSKNAFVYVYGEVKNPGRYPYSRGMRLLDAISLAGGYLETRAASKVRVSRKAKNRTYHTTCYIGALLKNSQNIPLEPGDVVIIPTSFMTKVADVVTYILQPVRSLIESLLGVASSAAKAAATSTTPAQ